MRTIAFVALLIAFAIPAQAQVSASSPSSGVSVLSSANGTGAEVTITIPGSHGLTNSVGVVNIVLNSDTACATIVAPDWVPVVSTETAGGNLCSRIYTHAFTASEETGASYTFSWSGPTTYTSKLLAIANVSEVDVSSGNSGYGTSWIAPQLVTNEGGDSLIALYMNSSNGEWTPPSQMSVVGKNTTAGYADLVTQAWQEAQGTSPQYEAGSAGGGQWGIAQLVAFRPSNR